MLNGVRKANAITHSSSGTLVLIDLQHLLFMAAYVWHVYLDNVETE
jgi:hypothetical protein